VLPPPTDPTAVHIAEVFRTVLGGRKPVAVEAVSQNLIISLLKSSDMITAMPGISVDRLADGVHRLEADWLTWSRHAGVISLRDNPLLPCCSRFLDLLREEMG
jgi:DNA-binding transcriptional LysR family regulator